MRQKIPVILMLVFMFFLYLIPTAFAADKNAGETCNPSTDTCPFGYSCLDADPGNPYGMGMICTNTQGGSGANGGGVNIGALWRGLFVRSPASPGDFVTGLLPQIYTIALILVLVYLIWGAYRYMISQGDPKAVQAAKSHLTWAVAGMIIIFLAYGLFQLLSSLLNNIY